MPPRSAHVNRREAPQLPSNGTPSIPTCFTLCARAFTRERSPGNRRALACARLGSARNSYGGLKCSDMTSSRDQTYGDVLYGASDAALELDGSKIQKESDHPDLFMLRNKGTFGFKLPYTWYTFRLQEIMICPVPGASNPLLLNHRSSRFHTPLSALSYSSNNLSVSSGLAFLNLIAVVEGVVHRPTLALGRLHIFARPTWWVYHPLGDWRAQT